MPEFAYIARNTAGQRLTGNVSAATRREALSLLANQALFPIDVQTASPVTETRHIRRVPPQLLATSYAQLADLLHSGVPLLRSLEVLQKQTSHVGLRTVLEEVHHHVEEGSTLAEAMGRFTNVFGEMPISMIRAGGEGGFLEEVLERVAQFTETQEDLKQRTWGAMAYPIVLIVVLVSVVTVLMVFMVPKFDTLFEQLRERHEMPALTEIVLGISNTMRRHGIWIVAVMVIVAWFGRGRLRSERGRLWLDRIKLRVPMMGPILLQLAVARFCRVLGTLLHNGVTILRALEISADATGNRILAIAIRQATENISAGQPLAGPLGACGHFPVAVVEMIAVAEQANNLENVLLSIADSMERRIWRRLDLAVRLLEPVLLLILASMVLVIVAALLLPLLKMSSTV